MRKLLSVVAAVAAMSVSAGAQSDQDASVHISGTTAPCAYADGFFTASRTCTQGDATAQVSSHLTFGAQVASQFTGPQADGAPLITYGSFDNHGAGNNLTVTGPSTPTDLVFYYTFAESESGAAGDARDLNFSAVIDGCGTVSFTGIANSTTGGSISCAYTGPNMVIGWRGEFDAYFTTGSTITQTFTILGFDPVLSDGTSLIGTDGLETSGFTPGFYTTAPEPTSLALLATGLIGVVPFAVRRRARTNASV